RLPGEVSVSVSSSHKISSPSSGAGSAFWFPAAGCPPSGGAASGNDTLLRSAGGFKEDCIDRINSRRYLTKGEFGARRSHSRSKSSNCVTVGPPGEGGLLTAGPLPVFLGSVASESPGRFRP